MVYVKLEGHSYKYEIENIIKQFYREEQICYTDTTPPVTNRGIFLYSKIISRPQSSLIITSLNGEKSFLAEKTREFMHEGTGSTELKRCQKREVSRQVYDLLTEYSGRKLPWGVLMGIRPAKLVHEMLQKEMNRQDILSELTGYYRLSEPKAKLLYEVAQSEKKILDNTPINSVSLYIGIPFCPTRCLYCSFTAYPISKYQGVVKAYLEALKKEIHAVNNEIIKRKGMKIDSIYIGGGTPTSLNAIELKYLLDSIEDILELSDVREYTIEAGRPDSINEEKLSTIKSSRVDRISINPQSMNESTLKLIGRQHSPQDILKTYELARKLGFKNINMDIIAGLPGENLQAFEKTLEQIKVMKPDSLTVHTLAIKKASLLYRQMDKYSELHEDEIEKMVDVAGHSAADMGMNPYYLYRQKNILGNLENIGYCTPGKESIYNVQIMEEKQTIIAFGADAVTKVVFPEEDRIERAFNVKGVEEYIARIDEMITRKKLLLQDIKHLSIDNG